MFDVAELGRKIAKEDFKTQEPIMREALLDAQFRLREANFSVVVVIAGVEAAGRGETTNVLLEWMDARRVETHAIDAPTEEEREKPRFYRFWKRLPPTGKVGIFLGSWYTRPITRHAMGQMEESAFEKKLTQIKAFERMLAHENVVLVKLWLHISKKTQRKRIEKMAQDPERAWRLSDKDLAYSERYDDFRRVADRALRRTSTDVAPWKVIEGTDRRYRHMQAAQIILDAIEDRLGNPPAKEPPSSGLPEPQAINIIRALNLGQRLEPEQYREQLNAEQARLGWLSRRLVEQKRSAVLVFEGSDAAGKGGAIRRITRALDARYYQVMSVAAPTDEERARPYLWRFWRHLPRHGHVAIFDRSWYGRVLVERLEGFCSQLDWQRAYSEINDFEEQLTEAGVIVVKFWLTISADEQLRRFKDREQTGFKRHKITEEDWRNRDKFGAYEAAACDMIAQTSTEIARWHLIEAEQKHFARVKVLRTLCDRLEAQLGEAKVPQAGDKSAFEKKKGRKKDKKDKKKA